MQSIMEIGVDFGRQRIDTKGAYSSVVAHAI